MIARKYFFSYKKYYDDGTGSFYYGHFTFLRISLFPDPSSVLEDCMERARENSSHIPGDHIHCIAFNRI